MKKILFVFDGTHFDEHIINYAIALNMQERISATGIFLPAVDYAEILYSFGGVMTGPLFISDPITIDDTILQKNVSRFREICKQNGIEHEVLADDTKHIVSEICSQTRFADMLVIGSSSFYDNLEETTRKDYVSNVLHKSECPVLLVPGPYTEPASIIMAYDGSEQSVYAIKQFTYLFPVLRNVEVSVVYVSTKNNEIPDKNNIADFVRLHYNNATVSKLNIDAKKYLETWLSERRDALLVTGAYSRTRISEAISKSFVDEVIGDHKIPVFVAHK